MALACFHKRLFSFFSLNSILSTFSDFSLDVRLLRAISELGYTTPTPIQAQAIPQVMTGMDLMGCAQTGTGKTAAFGLPLLHRLLQTPPPKGPRKPRMIVLAPTRELAQQIADNLRDYSKDTAIRGICVYGGSPIYKQIRELQRGKDVVVGTPGRVLDLIRQRALSLDCIEYFVLDEADRMLDMGFIADIRSIYAQVPEHPQTLMFSATMPAPIKTLANEMLVDPGHVEVAPQSSAAETVTQVLYHVARNQKMPLLHHVLDMEAKGQTLIFTRTKRWADELVDRLKEDGYFTEALHGDVKQTRRMKLLQDFKEGKLKVLVATDVAARGLDVKGVEHVINYDMPNEPENYVHRIGRTGRAGAEGVAFSFCDPSERAYLSDIEKILKKAIPLGDTPEGMEPAKNSNKKKKRPGNRGNNRRKPMFA